MKIGIILSGCGVYDGSEIHEAVLTLLAIEENNAEALCFAPDIDQHHVVNHLNGEEMQEKRNVLAESARIARGKISSLEKFNYEELDALVIPGGFGAAKNLTKWAFQGPDGAVNPDVKKAIAEMVLHNKPVCGLCMGPTVIAKALEGTSIHPLLTVGTTSEASPYDIVSISSGLEKAGSRAELKTVRELSVDAENKIVTAPCYMMEANILEIRNNIKAAVEKTISLI